MDGAMRGVISGRSHGSDHTKAGGEAFRGGASVRLDGGEKMPPSRQTANVAHVARNITFLHFSLFASDGLVAVRICR